MYFFVFARFRFFFGEEKLVALLIAILNVNKANKRQEKGKKLNKQLRVIHMQKGIIEFIFCNLPGQIPSTEFCNGGFEKREWQERLWFPPILMS